MNPNRQRGRRLPRRTFLRAAGVSIALPFLDAMIPVGLRVAKAAEATSPPRMLLIARDLGFHAPFFFPENTGKDYTPSPYLEVMTRHRDDFTVFSGVSHRGYPANHGTFAALFTGVAAENIRSGSDVRNTISLDQIVAAHVAGTTRFPSLVLGNAASLDSRGGKIPFELSPLKAFERLFVSGNKLEVAREQQRLKAGQSILDGVRSQAKSLASDLSSPDKDRIDLLLSSVREAEQRLQQDENWVTKPKPKADRQPFAVDYPRNLLKRARQWYDLAILALQTDSTRAINLALTSQTPVEIPGVEMKHHDASHHGQDPEKIRQLATIEKAELSEFAAFLDRIKNVSEGPQSLLDRTGVFLATNLGNANNHRCDNLPVLLAGGGFRHAGHVGFDRNDNAPLSNLYVRMLQQMGIEAERFGSSTGTMTEV